MAKRTRNNLPTRLLDVLRLIAQGHTYASIGRDLGLTEDGVKQRARDLFRDLGARDRAHAVAIGYQRGYLGEPCACRSGAST